MALMSEFVLGESRELISSCLATCVQSCPTIQTMKNSQKMYLVIVSSLFPIAAKVKLHNALPVLPNLSVLYLLNLIKIRSFDPLTPV